MTTIISSPLPVRSRWEYPAPAHGEQEEKTGTPHIRQIRLAASSPTDELRSWGLLDKLLSPPRLATTP
jgi:hypothetical protein